MSRMEREYKVLQEQMEKVEELKRSLGMRFPILTKGEKEIYYQLVKITEGEKK